MRAFICGLSGLHLEKSERSFLREAQPAGVIIFARNVQDPEQLRALIGDAKDAVGSDRTLILTDQEGGRVQRLSAPHWRKYPAAQAFGSAFPGDIERAAAAAYLSARLMGQDLHKIGINTACAPVLDIPIEGADRVIGDRAYGRDPFTVAALGRAAARGLLDSGVLPVIKHIPGHGRAKADSHFALPVIDTPLEELNETDFAPFRELRDLPLAMTAHVVLSAVDPAAPVTTSPSAISSIIRGLIGYDGLLMSDDLSMKALSGSMPERTRSCIAAGCDLVLHCNGDLEEMEAIAASAPPLDGDGARRFEAALAALSHPRPFDLAEAEQAVAETLSTVA